MKIFNGEGMILGRIAAAAAKAALLGNEVKVINCDKIVISGRKEVVFDWFKAKLARHGYPLKSAKFSRVPELYVKRSIRGMLPWKEQRGKEAFKKIMCYSGVPMELADQKYELLLGASVKKLPYLNYVTIKEISQHVGWERK